VIQLLLAFLLAVSGAAFGFDDAPFDDPALEARYRAFIREVRCPKCQNESIADSDAPVAADLRRKIREQMAGGATDEQVMDYLLARYGDFVLYRPRVTTTTWALWAGPFVFLGIGAVAFWRVLQTRRNQPLDEDGTA
jgi:cytochrome c-type biogenesis protein CcmH